VRPLLDLTACKTAILMQARTFAGMGMEQTAQPMWAAAAGCEERIAPRLDALGRSLEPFFNSMPFVNVTSSSYHTE
jgi:hypothetical protein